MLITPTTQTPARHQRRWLWLLLAAWLLTQSWAWMHRVEHGARLSGATSPHQTEWMTGAYLHDGADCEFLDHALLGAATNAAYTLPTWSAFEQAAPLTPTPTDARARTAQPYLARAPPLASKLTKDRTRV